MPDKQSHLADLLGASRLAADAVAGVTELVEAVHMAVLEKAVGKTITGPVAGVSAVVYRSITGVTRLVGGGVDSVLTRLVPALGEQDSWSGREALLAALNGVLGDRLAASANPLAIPMTLRRDGKPLALERAALADAIPDASGRILVLVHGLCMNDVQWQREGHDHGAMLAREAGYTPLYLHYNSGRHVACNGRELAALLQTLVMQWPVPPRELVMVCHSMGGLLARSACHYGAAEGHSWPGLLARMAFLGTPHHGAPLERGGNWVHLITDLTPFSAPFSRLAKLRSAGITDLRHGAVLDAECTGDRFAHGAPLPHTLPLPPTVRCFALAGTIGKQAGDLHDRIAGDGLVPLSSALGQHPEPTRTLQFAPSDQQVFFQTNHMELLSSPAVAAALLAKLSK